MVSSVVSIRPENELRLTSSSAILNGPAEHPRHGLRPHDAFALGLGPDVSDSILDRELLAGIVLLQGLDHRVGDLARAQHGARPHSCAPQSSPLIARSSR